MKKQIVLIFFTLFVGKAIVLYTYEVKSNLLKNISGFYKLLNLVVQSIKHNIATNFETASNGDITADNSKLITCNALDYPLTIQFRGSASIEHYYY